MSARNKVGIEAFVGAVCMLAFLASCKNTCSIEGIADASNIEGRTIRLKAVQPDGNWYVLDSCEVTHGSFSMACHFDSVLVTTLCIGEVPLMPVIVERGKVKVSITNLSLNASGTPLNNELYSFLDKKNELDKQVADLGHAESRMIMNGNSDYYIHHYVDSVYAVLSADMQDLVVGFIGDNYTNVLGLCGFSMLSNGLPYPVITPLIRSVLDKAPSSFLSNPIVSDFVKAADANASHKDVAFSY